MYDYLSARLFDHLRTQTIYIIRPLLLQSKAILQQSLDQQNLDQFFEQVLNIVIANDVKQKFKIILYGYFYNSYRSIDFHIKNINSTEFFAISRGFENVIQEVFTLEVSLNLQQKYNFLASKCTNYAEISSYFPPQQLTSLSEEEMLYDIVTLSNPLKLIFIPHFNAYRSLLENSLKSLERPYENNINNIILVMEQDIKTSNIISSSRLSSLSAIEIFNTPIRDLVKVDKLCKQNLILAYIDLLKAYVSLYKTNMIPKSMHKVKFIQSIIQALKLHIFKPKAKLVPGLENIFTTIFNKLDNIIADTKIMYRKIYAKQVIVSFIIEFNKNFLPNVNNDEEKNICVSLINLIEFSLALNMSKITEYINNNSDLSLVGHNLHNPLQNITYFKQLSTAIAASFSQDKLKQFIQVSNFNLESNNAMFLEKYFNVLVESIDDSRKDKSFLNKIVQDSIALSSSNAMPVFER